MKYFVSSGAQTHEVEVDGNRVTVYGVGLETERVEGAGRWTLGLEGERVEVAVQDERSRGIEAGSGKNKWSGGGGTVRAPMPGLVVRIEVAEGQRVDAGAGLVVVEAMKMENELRAPRPGMVQTVHVAVGQAVEKGASLVTLASPEPSG